MALPTIDSENCGNSLSRFLPLRSHTIYPTNVKTWADFLGSLGGVRAHEHVHRRESCLLDLYAFISFIY